MTLPVLLVHGMLDTHLLFYRMKRALDRAGFTDVRAMDIVPNDASICFEAMADQVAAAADRLLARSGQAQIDIIAYSMGTIAVRYYLQQLGGSARTRRFVSISGPHHGTRTSFLNDNAGVRQLRPGSPFLEELNREEGSWGGVEVFSFRSRFDLMIFPPATSILKNAQNKAFNVPFHPLMAQDRQVIREVVRALS